MKKDKIFFFKLRNENKISGEYVSSYNLIKSLKEIYSITKLNKEENQKKYISFQKIIELINFAKTSKNKREVIILKVPTTSQIPFVEIILKNTNIRRIYLVDGLNFEIKNFKLIKQMLLNEPILFFQRFLLNNNFLNFFLKFSKLEIVVSSKVQKKKLNYFLNKKSKVHIIENFNKNLKSRRNINNNLIGFYGHNYPVKGLDILAKANNKLINDGFNHWIYIKKPLRGKQIYFDYKNSFLQKNENLDKFMSKINTFIFPFCADFGTNIFPSVIVESMYKNKNLILPDFEIFRELVNKTNYQKKTIFFKKNNYMDLAKKIKLVILKKKKFKNKVIIRNFDHKKLVDKWKKILN